MTHEDARDALLSALVLFIFLACAGLASAAVL